MHHFPTSRKGGLQASTSARVGVGNSIMDCSMWGLMTTCSFGFQKPTVLQLK